MKRLALLLTFALFLLLPTSVAAAECQFVLGFATLRDLIGHEIVGECLENEHHGANGDALQRTSGGLLVWRKADNWTAFTDGYRTWINGPNGLVQRHNTERFDWEHDYAPGGGIATPTPTPTLTPTPEPTPIPTPTLRPTPTPTPVPSKASRAALAKRAIRALPWVQDGVGKFWNSQRRYGESPEEWEANTLRRLLRIADLSPEAAMVLVLKSWLRDGLIWEDEQVILRLSTIADGDPYSVLQLVTMPFLDSVTFNDSEILDALDGVLWYSPNKEKDLRDLLVHPAIRGGIKDGERAIVELLAIGKRTPEIATAIDTLPWVQDGIEASENRAIFVLYEASQGTRQLTSVLVQNSWVRDGLTKAEQDVVWDLLSMSRFSSRPDEPLALSILSMPFLKDVDEFDAQTLDSLRRLHVSDEVDYLRQVLSHPTLRGGITDNQRSRVVFLGLAVSSDSKRHFPDVLESLLDPRKSTVEERIISLPHAGRIRLAVAHIGRGKFRTLDNLERAVRRQEEFMLEAFPVKYVGVLAAEITPTAGGASFGGGMIAIDPGGENNLGLVAHEVAHKYGFGDSSWLIEGSAEVLRVASEGTSLRVRDVHLSLCRIAENLSEIDRIESVPRPDEGIDVFPYMTLNCPYVMGLGLFADLYTQLGDRKFRHGFRRLYLKARDGAHKNTCVELERAVCLVREAFVTDAATARDAAIAEPIIDFWYYGSRAEIRKRGR